MAVNSYDDRERRRRNFLLGVGAVAAGSLSFAPIRQGISRGIAGVLQGAGRLLGKSVPPPRIFSVASELESLGAARFANPTINKIARDELANMSSVGRAARFLQRGFGARALTLGEASALQVADPYSTGARNFFQTLGQGLASKERAAFEASVDLLPMGGMYNVGGKVYDLRGLADAGRRVGGFFANEFQVPLVPGWEGLSPGQLFPWLRGRQPQAFSQINSFTRGLLGEIHPNQDPILNSIVNPMIDKLRASVPGASEEFYNTWKVLKLGNRFVATWDANVVGAAGNLQDLLVQELPVGGELRPALHGLLKNRTEQVLSAQEARAAGVGGFRNWVGGGNLLEHFGMVSKFRGESNWAPRIFGRLLGQDISAGITPELGQDIRRAGRFLTSRGLPSRVEQELLTQAEKTIGGTFPELIGAAKAGTDQDILNFFTNIRKVEDTQGTRRIWRSENLRNLYNQFRTSPEGFLGRLKPHQPSNIIEKAFGGRRAQTGFDLTRQAIFDELEDIVATQGGGDAGFTNLIKGMSGLSPAERETALGYATGKGLLRRLSGFDGVAGTMSIEAKKQSHALGAINWLRQSGEAKEAAEAFTGRFTSFLDFGIPEAGRHLGTSNLFLPKGASFLTEFNKAREAGTGFLQAFFDTVKSPWGRQYSSFFTGNQRDFTAHTLHLENYPRRLNQLLSDVGLGLPDQDLLSGWSILQNLFLKRVAPAVGAYELYRYSDYKLHQAGLSGPSDIYAGARSKAGIARAQVMGKGGLFERFIGRRELFPGLDQYFSERTVDEEIEHQESGYEAVRKGRFWSFGSREEWRGGKIDYFLPSAVNVARSRWQETSEADLNTAAHWRNSWLPLPENYFLGPVWGLLHPYDYEQRHSMGPNPDRPALVSAPLFDPNTLHGTFLNPLLGWLKPRRLLHPEYVPREQGGRASKEDIRRINESMRLGLDRTGIETLTAGAATTIGGRGTGGGIGGGGFGVPGVVRVGGTGTGTSILNISAGGMLTLESLPGGIGEEGIANLGQSSIQRPGHGERLSRREIRHINKMTEAGMGGGQQIRANRLATQTKPFSEEDLDLLDYESGTVAGVKNIQDVMGLYGWMSKFAYNPKQRGPVLEPAGRSNLISHKFHNAGLGGGGPFSFIPAISELSEVWRRFYRRPDRMDYYNPVVNQMPSWLPGPEYFLDFRHGDPYARIPQGELRLPGEAYERTHNVHMMETRASSLGKPVHEMVQEMLFLDKPMSAFGEEVTEIGTMLHKKIQRRWKRMGILEAAETPLYNEKLGISGHLDAIIRMEGERRVAEIKTVGSKRFDRARTAPFEEHLDQINFYLHETGLKHGVVLYVNRDDPTQVQLHRVGFNQGRFNRTISRVEEARQRLGGMVSDGLISRGDLYDPVSRFEVLSDVAPYSQQYAQVREYITAQNRRGQLSEEDNTRFQLAKKRVAQQKRRVQVYPYRFANMDVDYGNYTVDKILDPNTFMIRGSTNPIRLAGLRSSQARIEEEYGEAPEGMTLAEHQFSQFGIVPGARVRLGLEGDPLRRIADDVLQTQHAVVYSRGRNVNQALIEAGVGTEKETDYSSTGVAARFSPGEIRKGKWYERFAHSDNPISNKFFRVRSPLEELERGIVFGTNLGNWNNPAASYLWPTLASFATRHPISAGLSTGVFASFFFRSRQAKMVAAGIGAGVGTAISLGRMAYEGITGQTWKPSWTNRREELEEYWDTLKYVKYRALSAQYEKLAKENEGVDVEKIAQDFYGQGEGRKRRKNWLEKQKRELLRKGSRGVEVSQELAQVNSELEQLKEQRAENIAERSSVYQQILKEKGVNPEDTAGRAPMWGKLKEVAGREDARIARRKELMAEKRRLIEAGHNQDEVARIQDEIDKTNQPIGAMKLGPLATRALAYREAFRSTLYGFDPGSSPFINLFRAFPKYKRELISPFIEKSNEEERQRIFDLLPRQEQRVLGSYLGIDRSEIPDRPKLSEYFREHQLPDPSWKGWSEDTNLEDLKLRAIRGEKLDPLQSGIYDLQIDDAHSRTESIPVPTLRGSTSDLRNTLNSLLSGHGLQQVNIRVDIQPHDEEQDDIQVDLRLRQKREDDLRSAIQDWG